MHRITKTKRMYKNYTVLYKDENGKGRKGKMFAKEGQIEDMFNWKFPNCEMLNIKSTLV